jgi:hypothetical protein
MSTPPPSPVEKTEPPAAAAAPRDQKPAPLWIRMLLLLGALAIVAVSAVMLYSVSLAKQTAEALSNTFQPKVKYSTILSGTIGELDNTPKLEVLSANIVAEVTQMNTTTFIGINVGSAKAVVKAPAKVRFYVPLNDLSLDDFTYEPEERRMVVRVVRPILDNDFVDVDTNPDRMIVETEYGWRPLSLFKGREVRDDAMRHLRDAALAQGRHELLRDRAEANAKKIIADKMGKVRDALLQDGVKLEVEFKN